MLINMQAVGLLILTGISGNSQSVQRDSVAFCEAESFLSKNPNHIEVLLLASKLGSSLAGNSPNGALKTQYIVRATTYAERSIILKSTSKEAHLNYIIAIGLQSANAKSPTEKLKHASIIKREADYLLSLDSSYAPAYFIIGKWHLSLASLSWLEKTACDFLFGGMPEDVSLENAMQYFEKAIQLQPDCILYHYNKALTLKKLGRTKEAIVVSKFSLQLPIRDANDRIRRENCAELLKELLQ